MISDTDILIKLHKESMWFLENEREDDDEEASKKYFKTFNELFHLVEKYGTKFPSHIIDRITIQQYIILKKCGVNLNSIKKLIESETEETEITTGAVNSDEEEIKFIPPRFITKAEHPFMNSILPTFTDIPPLRYINALPIPSPKLPELPNFKAMSSGPIELEDDE
jgi:hypothetical protein